MWDDIINLDRLLGGSGNFSMAGHKHSHGSGNYTVPYDSKLSEPNTIYLCCLIYKEIHVYQEMILNAFNLNASQKKASLTDLHYRCHTADNIAKDIDISLDAPYSWYDFRSSTTCTSLIT